MTHSELTSFMRTGVRRGTWSKLSIVDRALFRCGIWVAKTRGQIANTTLIVGIRRILVRLLATVRNRIYEAGLTRARRLRKNYLSAGVFDWAPEVKDLIFRPDYIMYLGVMELNT